MPRRSDRLAWLALLAVVAGCGGPRAAQQAAPAPVRTRPAPGRPAPARPQPRPAVSRLVVTVVDGDTLRRVGGAVVRLGTRGTRSDAGGEAAIRVRRRGAYRVAAWAPGYAGRTVRLDFRHSRFRTIRIYRRALQWTLYGADAARTQSRAGIRLRPPFRLVWSRGLGGPIEFPAVVSDGVAYIGNRHGTIIAISMRNGAVVWRRVTRHGRMASSPALVGDRLVVHGMDGVVRVLDPASGRLLSSFSVGSPIESSPVVRDGVDYFGAWDGRVYALDLRRRRLLWTFRSGYKITSSAALAGGTLYVGDYGGRVLALSTATGRLRWAGYVDGRVYGTPAVAYGRVFVPSSSGRSLTAFSTGGRRLWSVRAGSYVYSSPAVWGGRVFFGSYDGRLYAVWAATGRPDWTVWTGGPVSGAAVVVDGVAYAGSFAHRIVGVDVPTGRVLLSFPHGEYVPVSGNGGRLLLHGYSRLYAVAPARRATSRSERSAGSRRPSGRRATGTRGRARASGSARPGAGS